MSEGSRSDVVESLRTAVTGDVLAPGDAGYDEARRVHNGMIDKHPAVIVRCLTSADVATSVDAARQAGLEISVKGGGHNVAGTAATEGGLMIDLSAMKAVEIDLETNTVTAEAGLTWNEFNEAAAVHGLATTGGVVSTTGIAGLTLGGGLGWLMGRHGMAVDNLLSVEMVTAEGEVLTASDEDNPDLFWALRGGGGNFGVATKFGYQLHPLSNVVGGIVAHPFAAATDVLGFYRQTADDLPEDLTLFAGLVHAPDGSGAKIVAMLACHSGDADQAEADVAPIKAFGPPIIDLISPMPYTVMNSLLDAQFPPGGRYYWKSAFFQSLSDDALAALISAFGATPSPMNGMVLEVFHGAVTRVPVDAMAYPHRQPGYNLVIAGGWMSPSKDDANIAWVRSTFDALRPFMADRRYVNYLAGDEPGAVRQAYGPNYDRLLELKRRYDPTNLFHLNQNIDPSSG